MAKVNPEDPVAVILAIEAVTGEVLPNEKYDRLKDEDYHAFCDRLVKAREQDRAAEESQEKIAI